MCKDSNVSRKIDTNIFKLNHCVTSSETEQTLQE
jgi:hypothetical protein